MNPLVSALLRLVLTFAGLVVTLLPRRAELAFGAALGRFGLIVDPKRRRVAEENMRRCLPELSPAARAELLRENYEHYGILALELLHMFSPVPGHYKRYVLRTTEFLGLEHWRKAHDRGKGVLFVSAHLANWELMAARGAMSGIPITMVTRRLKPQWLLEHIERTRLSCGVRAAYQPRTIPIIMKGLRAGESIGFVLDQYMAPPAGVPARFFGIKVDTLAAVGTLAERTGAAIIPASQRRGKDGVVRVFVEPELDLGEALHDPVAATEFLSKRVEDWIRAEPAQWLWVHRRFKNVVWPAEPADARAS